MHRVPRQPRASPVAALLLALAASACGGSAPSAPARTNTPSAAATPASSASSGTGEIATLANEARGTTTYVRLNAVVKLTLTADAGYAFSAPSSNDQTVLRTTTSSQIAAGATAEFRAVQPGNATIQAVENPKCLPLCGLPSRLWEATVVVTSHPVP